MTVYVETDCKIEHEGRTFESGGAVVTPEYLVAYPAENGVLRDWHGEELGTWRSVAQWRVNSWMGEYMHQIEATVDGVTYTGRGLGENMIYRGKRKRSTPRSTATATSSTSARREGVCV